MDKKIFILIPLLIIVVTMVLKFKSPAADLPETTPTVTPTLVVQSTTEIITQAFSQKYNKPVSDFVIETTVDTGLFAKGSVNFKDEMGGGLWFAAKKDNGWELAFDGNGIIDCASANKYNFPVELIPSCLDAQNNNELVQRQ